MEPGRWDVAIRRGAVETGGEAERGGRRESRRNAPAPWVERAPWVFVKAREHLPPVWQLLSPPPYFSYRSLFALQTVPPVFFTSFARCLSLCSWQVTSIRHVPLMKPKLTHVLHFGGCVRRRVRDLRNRTHILETLGTHTCVCLEIVYWFRSCNFCLYLSKIYFFHMSHGEKSAFPQTSCSLLKRFYTNQRGFAIRCHRKALRFK